MLKVQRLKIAILLIFKVVVLFLYYSESINFLQEKNWLDCFSL